MLEILGQLFMAGLGLMMFKVDRRHKLAILLFAALCLTCVQLSFMPFAKGCFGYLPLCFLLSELRNWRRHYVEMRQTVVWGMMLLMMVSAIAFALNSPHCDTVVLKAKLVYSELMQKTFLMAFAMFCIWDEKDLKPLLKYAFYGLLLLTALGIINYITKQSFWVSAFHDDEYGKVAGEMYTYADRFRVQSMFFLAFDYGFTSILVALLFFYARIKGLIEEKRFLIAEACCLFAIYFSACRTVHVCFLLACVAYFVCAYRMRKWVAGLVVAGLAAVLILPQIPGFQDYAEMFQNALSTDTINMAAGGSSIGMRILQLTTVLYYTRTNLLFGMGKDYFNIDLGRADVVAGAGSAHFDRDLHGIEGVYLNYLLHRGIFGYLCYLIFYLTFFVSAFRLRRYDKHTFAFFASVFAAYFFFAHATGELSSVPITMLMMGIALKLLYVKSGKLVRGTNVKKQIKEDYEDDGK